MKRIMGLEIPDWQAALWSLGQAGYIVRSGSVTLAIDPYLSDSAAAGSPLFHRALPAPIAPEELRVDIFVVTHDHLDHLDPETIGRYRHKDSTEFVAPRFAARKLTQLGIPDEHIRRIDAGESLTVRDVTITGVFALPTGTDVLDTTGYLIAFPNGRSFYHPSDTAFCKLLLDAAPNAEVLLPPINGKWGNLDVDQAVELTRAVGPRFVLPNHYDLFPLNSENPETFRFFCNEALPQVTCVVPQIMQPFIWGER